MAKHKNLIKALTFSITVLLLFSSPAFSQSMNSGMHNWGNNALNNKNLTKDQIKKIKDIKEQYRKKTIPIRQKLNTLKTEAYNYSLNDNIKVDKIKDYRQQIRDAQAQIADTRLDETAEINKVLPEDQQISLKKYLAQFGTGNGMMGRCGMMSKMMGYGSHGMMGMMGRGSQGMMGMMGRIMGNGMMGKGMHGNGSGRMMGGSGMMNRNNSGNMLNSNKND